MLTSIDSPHSSIGDVIYPRDKIASTVRLLAQRYVNDLEMDADVTIIGVSDGCMFFLPSFAQEMQKEYGTSSPCKIKLCSIRAEKEDGLTCITGGPKFVEGHVLILDDICDSGTTLKSVYDYIQDMNPAATIHTMVLLKKTCYQTAIPIDYFGLEYDEPGFLIGYGMDYNNMFRALPDIHELVMIRDLNDYHVTEYPEDVLTSVANDLATTEEWETICCVS